MTVVSVKVKCVSPPSDMVIKNLDRKVRPSHVAHPESTPLRFTIPLLSRPRSPYLNSSNGYVTKHFRWKNQACRDCTRLILLRSIASNPSAAASDSLREDLHGRLGSWRHPSIARRFNHANFPPGQSWYGMIPTPLSPCCDHPTAPGSFADPPAHK